MDLGKVAIAIRNVEGVKDLHYLNVWSVCSHITALSVHVEVAEGYEDGRSGLLHRIEHALEHGFHITHTTIQLECSDCNGGPLIKPLQHRQRQEACCDHDH
jgi:cobalt-zinc-cadmium efflux system protein